MKLSTACKRWLKSAAGGARKVLHLPGKEDWFFGAVALQPSRFHFRQDAVFNGQTYAQFLEQLAGCYPRRQVILIHDHVAYHRAPEIRDWRGVISGSK